MKRIFSLIALTAAMFAAIAVDAAVLSETDAGIAASRWARRPRLGVRLSERRSGVRRYVTAQGGVFYGVQLGASGSVLVADDGGRARVIAFTRQPLGSISTNSPLYALVSRDLALRAEAFSVAAPGTIEDEADVDDLRVSPLLSTKWGQSYAYTESNTFAKVRCYNLYTPVLELKLETPTGAELFPGESELTYESPCGCVATAMAQTLRYWGEPTTRREFTNTIAHRVTPFTLIGQYNAIGKSVNYTNLEDWKFVEKEVTRSQRRYDWDLMAESPLAANEDSYGVVTWEGFPIDAGNCEEIGTLCYDCGVAAGLQYDYNSTGLLVTDMANIPFAITNVFGYASAILSDDDNGLTRDASKRARAVLANLDAGRPSILLVSGGLGGHAIVADGYGFSGGEAMPYVHLNMGWTGQCDIWYSLPDINVSENPERFSGFKVVDGVVYNITPYSAQVGEVVSGRVTGPDGEPVAGVEVEACDMSGGQVATATTEANGIYYFILPASADGYDIFAVSGDLVGDAYTGSVDESTDGVVGNSWGNDLALGLPTARAGARLFTDFLHAVGYAQRVGEPLVEVLRPCMLSGGGDIAFSTNLAIVATNASPRLSPVVFSGDGGEVSVAAGARLSLSNIVFTSVRPDGLVTVDVASDGVVAVAGTVIVDSISTAEAVGFELAGPLECGVVLKCSVAKVAGSAFGVASFADAAEYAAYVFNGFDFELAGVAAGGVLKWAAGVPVPPAAAYAVFVGDSGTLGFRSFDQLISSTSGVGEMHLLRRCRFTAKTLFANDCLLTSDNGDGLFVEGGGFTVTNSTLTISNIVINGSAPNPLFTLGIMVKRGTTKEYHKGNLVLADGACIAGYANTVRQNSSGGAVSVQYGTARLLAGSAIDGCTVKAALHGGGVYLKSGLSELELAGGTITNCAAGAIGGGVYAEGAATIRVTAPSFVAGNFCIGDDGATTADSDVYSYGGDISRFVLAGDASGGLIGVDRADGSVGVPVAGDAFMSVEVDAQTAANSAGAFFSNDAELVGAVSDDASSLVWMDVPSPGQCEPDRAVAVVVYDEDGETNYYPTVRAALDNLRGDATVFVATNYVSDVVDEEDWYLYTDVDILHNVRICTVEGADTPAKVYRYFYSSLLSYSGPSTIYVRPGGTLTLSNIVLTTATSLLADYALLAADGGMLVMEDGAEVSDIFQMGMYMSNGNRASGAVNVYNDGVFRMTGGTIKKCANYHWSSEADYSVGAGVLVDNATAYFEGGSVVNCTAYRYAGVYIGNKGKAYVSGEFTAANGSTFAYAGSTAVDSNFSVQDLSSLVLAGPLAGTVGYSEGVKASTNIFGEVGCELTYEVVASAANFVHDITGALGAVATNSEGKAVLVWSTAFPAGEDSFEEAGEVYYRVASTPPPPPGYTIHYIGGVGVSGEMDDTECLYGKVYNLRKCTLSKGGARFAGWAWNGRLYDDGILIFNLSDVPGDELDFVAVWVDE